MLQMHQCNSHNKCSTILAKKCAYSRETHLLPALRGRRQVSRTLSSPDMADDKKGLTRSAVQYEPVFTLFDIKICKGCGYHAACL